ncbi:hypothetical protein U7230_10120 [Carboxydochorda subterranea]|uniref:Uncharacterized protein n=1 Tax=Carboxydichorda subterranea TaxID=3109565 RepID=A0ABZ1BUH2_9FIRM|nr:hypothetical protein [Limnochorda sp. L945t]WRP16452.1 hypothetical protein U7230_10120 [Limnochorda sp. L945t]
MTPDDLWERYTQLSAEQPLDLEAFVRMAAQGELGEPVSPPALEAFLRRVEAMMLANIDTKLEEAPHFHAMRDDAVERTQAMIADLIARFATPRSHPAPPGPSAPGPRAPGA